MIGSASEKNYSAAVAGRGLRATFRNEREKALWLIPSDSVLDSWSALNTTDIVRLTLYKLLVLTDDFRLYYGDSVQSHNGETPQLMHNETKVS
jgi:hypothetical protein